MTYSCLTVGAIDGIYRNKAAVFQKKAINFL